MAKKKRSPYKRLAYTYTFFDAIRTGFAERYVEAFATFLRASPFQFSLLVSLPQFFSGIFQLFTLRLLRVSKKRKTFIEQATIIQAVVWLAVILLAFTNSSAAIFAYILLIIIYVIVTMLQYPVWYSWLTDISPEAERGSILAKKSKVTNAVTIVSFISGGITLWFADRLLGDVAFGFAFMFVIGVLGTLKGLQTLKTVEEPRFEMDRPQISFKKFLQGMRKNGQGVLIIYLSLMSLSIYVAAPFYTVYLLTSLGMDYLQFSVLMVLPLLIRVVYSRRIGKLIDRYGPLRMLKLSSLLIAFTPVFWTLNDNFYWLLFVQFYAGFSTGAYELAALTVIINETSSANRISLISYFNFFSGMFILAGSLLSNLFLKFGPFSIVFLNAFLWSAILRFAVLTIPLRRKEKDWYAQTDMRSLSGMVFSGLSPQYMMRKMIVIKDKLAMSPDIDARLKDGSVIHIQRKKKK